MLGLTLVHVGSLRPSAAVSSPSCRPGSRQRPPFGGSIWQRCHRISCRPWPAESSRWNRSGLCSSRAYNKIFKLQKLYCVQINLFRVNRKFIEPLCILLSIVFPTDNVYVAGFRYKCFKSLQNMEKCCFRQITFLPRE